MAYVQSLEERLKNMEMLLAQMSGSDSALSPKPSGVEVATGSLDGTSSAGHSPPDAGSSKNMLVSSNATLGHSAPTRESRFMARVEEQPAELSDEEADLHLSHIEQNFKNMHVSDRFFGKSSGIRLIKSAMNLKMEHAAKDNVPKWQFPRRRREFWVAQPVNSFL